MEKNKLDEIKKVLVAKFGLSEKASPQKTLATWNNLEPYQQRELLEGKVNETETEKIKKTEAPKGVSDESNSIRGTE